MLIFIETNIFHYNWHLDSANFKLLLNYLSNSKSQLLISKLVCEEVQNKYEQEKNSALEKIRQGIEQLENASRIKVPIDQSTLKNEFDFLNHLKTATENLIIFDYENIPHNKIVKRIFKKTKPFQVNEKGYRDTLIWLSFLNYLKENNVKEEVIFINNNKNDFYEKSELKFHNDLLNDISEFNIQCDIKVFDLLPSFIKENIITEEHEVVYEEIFELYINDNDELIETTLENFINTLPINQFKELILKENDLSSELNYFTSFNFEVFEGIEDPNLIRCKKINENKFYINYNFNLRRCELKFNNPDSDNMNLVYISKKYPNFPINDFDKEIILYKRVDFETSFEYDIQNNTISGFNVDRMKFI